MTKQTRKTVPIAIQVQVYCRDGWLCYICRRPLIFPFALKHLALLAAQAGIAGPLDYYNPQWRRDAAPLLDELGASIDHVQAFAKGGAHGIENFRAICARCNARKSASSHEQFVAESKPWRVKGKHGEPKHWDGLASVFVALAEKSQQPLTATEKKWLSALRDYGASAAGAQ